MKHISLICCLCLVAAAAMAQTKRSFSLTDGEAVYLLPNENQIWNNNRYSDTLDDVDCIYLSKLLDEDDAQYYPLRLLDCLDSCKAGSTKLYKWAAVKSAEGSENRMRGLYFYALTNTTIQPLSFIIPTDDAFAFVPYVLSFATSYPLVLKLQCNTKSGHSASTPVLCEGWIYDIQNDERVGSYLRNFSLTANDIDEALKRVLLQHTVAGDLNSGNEYFKSLDGTVVRYKDGKFQSTREIQLEREQGIVRRANVVEHKSRGNSDFYVVDRVLTQTDRSVWATLSADERCSGFLALCDELAQEAKEKYEQEGLDNTDNADLQILTTIFYERRSSLNKCVTMFSDADFTLFVPSNAAIAAERASGRLNTFEQKRDFVFYHFCFGSEFADRLPFEARRHATPLVVGKGRCTNPTLTISSSGNGTLSVTDATGQTHNVLPDGKNIFTYDFYAVDDSNRETNIHMPHNMSVKDITYKHIGCQAPGVVHLIDGVLRYAKE